MPLPLYKAVEVRYKVTDSIIKRPPSELVIQLHPDEFAQLEREGSPRIQVAYQDHDGHVHHVDVSFVNAIRQITPIGQNRFYLVTYSVPLQGI